MKGLLLFVCVVIVHVNSQKYCCSKPLPPPCRSVPPRPRPPLPCPRPLPPCPKPCPPPCPRPYPYEYSAPIIEYCDYNLPVMSPIVTYDTCSAAPPSCNCPAPPSLPVCPSLPPACGPFLGALPFPNGLLSPCSGGCRDFSVPPLSPLSPLGLINPFLPAASPVSALAPTVSCLYPPINPCGCGCNYLKKIPVPPPCI